jgi:hypothetical protein
LTGIDVQTIALPRNPSSDHTSLPAGSTVFPLLIFYSLETVPGTFSATLNTANVSSLFHPVPGGHEFVNVPLQSGRNVLVLSINGNLPSRTASDTAALPSLYLSLEKTGLAFYCARPAVFVFG